jgi:predicted transcriptional regulator
VLCGKRLQIFAREIARRAKRDVRAVHSDVHLLLRVGVLQKAENGGVEFP